MTQSNTLRKLLAATSAAAALAGGAAFAGDYGKVVIDDKNPLECTPDPAFCSIYDAGKIYQSDNSFVKSVSLVGRYHGQYLSHSLDVGDDSYGANYWEHRRLRIGTKIEFNNGWTFFNNWNVGAGGEGGSEVFNGRGFFNSIDEMYLKGKVGGIGVQIGKQKQKITREYSTSSKRIITAERSHIVNEVSGAKPWGITFSGKAFDMKHKLGFWLGGFERDSADHPIDFPGWEGARGGISYNLEKELTDATTLFFDYVYTNNSNGDVEPRGEIGDRADANALNNYNHTFALGTESSWDIDGCREWGLITDVIWATGRLADGNTSGTTLADAIPSGEDTFGFVLLGHYDLTEKLELVGRYAYASTSRLHRPFRQSGDGAIPRFNLEDVHTFYVGLNYRICGDNLKLLAGYELLEADTFGGQNSVSGDSWVLGVRTYW